MCQEVVLQWDETLTDRDQVSHTWTGIYLEQTPPPPAFLFPRRWIKSLGRWDKDESHNANERDSLAGMVPESSPLV